MILLIDNYDSFSYNLYQMIGTAMQENKDFCNEQGEPDLKVIRNDVMTVEEIKELAPSGIIISPGPGRPSDAGIIEEVVQKLHGLIPILGVCLGEQAICEAFGATITYASKLMHGKQSDAGIDTGSPLFKGLPETVKVARYHSLAVDDSTLPSELKVTARADDGEVMAVEHVSDRVYGVQFHPESIMTPEGMTMLKNYLEITRA